MYHLMSAFQEAHMLIKSVTRSGLRRYKSKIVTICHIHHLECRHRDDACHTSSALFQNVLFKLLFLFKSILLLNTVCL